MKTRLLLASTAVGLSLAVALPAAALSLSDVFGNGSANVNGSAQAETSAGASGSGSGSSAQTGTSGSVSGSANASGTNGNTGSNFGAEVTSAIKTMLGRDNATSSDGEDHICTMDAKQCPDGSYVGRTGPNCAFAACPGETTTGNNGNGNSGTNGNAEVNGNSGLHLGSIIVSRGDVRSNAVAATSNDWSQVRSDSDLSGYIAAQIKSDDNLEKVKVSSDNVAVTYKQHARFLGFLPTTLKATAMVESDGNVSVSYPWYSFLYAKTSNVDDVETNLKARVNAAFSAEGDERGATVSGNTQAEVSAEARSEARARLVAEIRAALEEANNVDVSAEASTTANGSVRTQ